MKREINGTMFYGNKVSEYGIKNGRVDYGTFAKAFDAVLNNEIIRNTFDIGVWEQINGTNECDDDEYEEIFQYYIVSETGADTIRYWTDDPLFYSEPLDMYVWGVTHFGTGWDYVLTEIEINSK